METKDLSFKKLALSVLITFIVPCICYELVIQGTIKPEVSFLIVVATSVVVGTKIILQLTNDNTFNEVSDISSWLIITLIYGVFRMLTGKTMIGSHIVLAGIYPGFMLFITFVLKAYNFIVYLIKDAKDTGKVERQLIHKASTSP